MKVIRIIDLLNKIANDEELPKYIKYNDYELTYDEDTEDYYNEPSCSYSLLNDIHYKLNDEIEIIEDTPKEDKNIKKIDLPIPSLSPQLIFLTTKINEIIDRLNGEDNED